MTTLVVIAKAPVPGRVKTRLTPVLTPHQAAEVAEAALADSLDAVRATPAARRVLVLDGGPLAWLPPGLDVVPQVPGGLDVRLAAAFGACSGPTLLIGMDTPQVTPHLLTVDWTDGDGPVDAWFGAAADGGFWALGLRRPDPSLLLGVPMSVPHTGRAQYARLVGAGLRVRALPELRDVDTVADLAAVAELAPGTRTAALARTLGVTGVTGTPPVTGATRMSAPTGTADLTGARAAEGATSRVSA